MAIIETGNGKLYWQQGREKMLIEPWGRHSLRVRVSRNSCIDQAENWALLPQEEQAGAVVSRDEAQGSVSIQNGNIRATIESVDPTSFEQVVEGLIQAKNVYIVGTRASTPLVEFFGYYLNFVLDGVHAVTSGTSDVFDQLIRVSAEDVVLGISFPRYSSRTLEGMRFAKERGAKVYAITDSQLSPLAETADITLFARSDMVSFADSLVAPMALINAVIVALSMRKKDEVSARFAQLEGIWHKNRVYAGRENG